MEKGTYSEAFYNFLEGNKIYNSDTRFLNALGFSFFMIGQNEKALEALKASISLNSAQEEVRRLILEIQEKIKR